MIVWKKHGITIFKSALFETLSTVVETPDLVLIADPCWLPHEVQEIRSYVNTRIGSRPLYLLFTHSDYDHIIGYGAFPEAQVIASQALRDRPSADQEDILEQIRTFDDSYYIARDYETSYPSVDLAYGADGQQFKLGSTVLTFYQASGHNPDGLMTVVEPIGLLLAGDYVSDIEFPYIYHDSYAYEATLAKLDALLDRHDVTMLVPGHGNPTEDLAEAKRRQHDSLTYIRELREAVASGDQVRLDAMMEGQLHPRTKKTFHEGNQRLIRQELQESRQRS